MPAVQVRDLEKETYERLTSSARANHRSISQETRVAIETYLETGAVTEARETESRRRRRQALFEKIRSEAAVNLPDELPSPEELVREDREAR